MRELNVQIEDLVRIGNGAGSRHNDPHYEPNGYMLRSIKRSSELDAILIEDSDFKETINNGKILWITS